MKLRREARQSTLVVSATKYAAYRTKPVLSGPFRTNGCLPELTRKVIPSNNVPKIILKSLLNSRSDMHDFLRHLSSKFNFVASSKLRRLDFGKTVRGL